METQKELSTESTESPSPALERHPLLLPTNEGLRLSDRFANAGCARQARGDLGKASDLFMMALRYDPNHFESYYNLGNIYYDKADYQQACDHYKRASNLCPRFPLGWFNLALAYLKLGSLKTATQMLRKYELLISGDSDAAILRTIIETKLRQGSSA